MRSRFGLLAAAMSLAASVGVATGSSTPATAPVSGKDPVRQYRRRGSRPGRGKLEYTPDEHERRITAAGEKRQRRCNRNLRIAYAATQKQGR